jgi:hypothetical protein
VVASLSTPFGFCKNKKVAKGKDAFSSSQPLLSHFLLFLLLALKRHPKRNSRSKSR